MQRRYRTGRSIDSRSWSSDSSHRGISIKKIRSGINAKPTSSVQEQLRYPHFSLGQISGFIGMNLQFHNLTFEQFVAGEVATICNSINLAERQGRTELLQRITQWNLRASISWAQVRNAYAHILRKIENRETTWEDDWDRYERLIYDKVITNHGNNVRTQKQPSSIKKQNETVWFCKNYQKPEGCPKDSPHTGRIGNQIRTMIHICATCWLRDKQKRSHSEASIDCPHRDN